MPQGKAYYAKARAGVTEGERGVENMGRRTPLEWDWIGFSKK